MNILVCGGRDFADAHALNAELDGIHREKTITRLIHGAARGADALAAAWARSRNIPTSAFPAYWSTDGKAGRIPAQRSDAPARQARAGGCLPRRQGHGAYGRPGQGVGHRRSARNRQSIQPGNLRLAHNLKGLTP